MNNYDKVLGISVKVNQAEVQKQLDSLKKIIQDTTGVNITGGATDVAGQIKQAFEGANKSLQRHSNLIMDIHRNILPLVAEVYVLKRAWDSTVGAALEYLATIETASLGISAAYMTGGQYIDQTTGKVLQGQAALRAAQEDTRKVLKDLQLANFETIATLDQLIVAYQVTLPVALSKGFDKKQVLEFTKAMVQAAGAIGLPFNQMGEETRSLLMGTINPRNTRIATVLGIRNEDIRQYRGDAEGLFNFLMDKLKAFQVAGIEAQTTWNGLWSNTKDIALMLGGQAFEPLFNAIKKGLMDMQKGALAVDEATGKITGFKPEFLESIKSVQTGVEEMIADFRRLMMLTDKIGGSLSSLMYYGTKAEYYASLGLWKGADEASKKWEEINKMLEARYRANDKALMDMAMASQGFEPAAANKVRMLERSGITSESLGLSKVVTDYGQVLYYQKELAKITAGYKANPPKDDTKSNVYTGTRVAAIKKEYEAMLKTQKSCEELSLTYLDMFHRAGMLSDREYYGQREDELLTGMNAELSTLQNMRDKLQKAYEEGIANAKTPEKAVALREKMTAELSALDEKVVQKQREVGQKVVKSWEQNYERLRTIIARAYQTELEITKTFIDDKLDAVKSANKVEEQLNKYLYENGLVTATAYYDRELSLIKRNTQAEKDKLTAQYESTREKQDKDFLLSGATPNGEITEKGRQILAEQEKDYFTYTANIAKMDRQMTADIIHKRLEMADSLKMLYEGPDGLLSVTRKALRDIELEYGNTGKNIYDAMRGMAGDFNSALDAFFDSSSDKAGKGKELLKSIFDSMAKETRGIFTKQVTGLMTSGLKKLLGGEDTARWLQELLGATTGQGAGKQSLVSLTTSQTAAEGALTATYQTQIPVIMELTAAYHELAAAKSATGGGLFGGLFGGGGGIDTSTMPAWAEMAGGVAKGGVFATPDLTPYLNQIVNSPTLFKFAKGAVFAEAGPEAVMPLARTSSGNLGVRAIGGGQTVVHHHYYYINAMDAKSFDSYVKRNRGSILGLIDNDFKKNGSLRATVRKTT